MIAEAITMAALLTLTGWVAYRLPEANKLDKKIRASLKDSAKALDKTSSTD